MNLRRLSGTQGYALFVAVVVVVVVVYLFLSGAFDSSSGNGGDQVQQVEPIVVDASGAAEIVALEQSARVGQLDIAVERVTWTNEIRTAGRTQSAAERFTVVRLNAVNRGAAPVELLPQQLQMVAADGRIFSLDPQISLGAAQYEPQPTLAPPAALQPGLAVPLLLVFPTPNEASGLSLRIHGHYVDFALEDE